MSPNLPSLSLNFGYCCLIAGLDAGEFYEEDLLGSGHPRDFNCETTDCSSSLLNVVSLAAGSYSSSLLNVVSLAAGSYSSSLLNVVSLTAGSYSSSLLNVVSLAAGSYSSSLLNVVALASGS